MSPPAICSTAAPSVAPRGRRGKLSLLAALVLVAIPAALPAATWEGIDVVVDGDWPGCSLGGYFPIRIQVVNRGQPRVMTFTFASNYGNMPTVTKTVAVQTERLAFSLLVPCVGNESYGLVRVAVDGQHVTELNHSLSLPPARSWDRQGPAVLLVDTKDTDWSNFKSALETLLGATSSTTPSGPTYYGSSPTITVGDDHKYIPADALPGEWQAYTGLDLVTLSADTLRKLDREDRAALLKWVDCGGTILTFDAGDIDSAGPTVDQLLRDADQSLAAAEWRTLGTGANRWSQRDQLLGRLVAVPADPFRQFDATGWQALLTGIGHDRWEWTERYGFSARYPSPNFMDFLVPSVKGVPVVAFLILITLFAILIGPVNYLYLWKQKRLYLLVVTIPLIALLTSLSLFGYSVVAHGFSTRARLRSLTLVDQPTNTAVCDSRVSLYSGLAPSAGLTFSRDSAVFPLWAPETGFEAGSVDWTDSQHFASGWLRSRTRTQFFITTHRNERGRLEVVPEAETLSISNGFEWDLESLLVADDAGRLFYGENIAAGAGARLHPATAEQLASLGRRIQRDPLAPPPHAPASTSYSSYPYGGHYYGGPPATAYSLNQAERLIQSLTSPAAFEAGPQRRRWYAGILTKEPGIDVGLTRFSEEASLHVLTGNY